MPKTVIDHTESVYIPKLRTLAFRRPDRAASQDTSLPPLIVSMPRTPEWPPLRNAEAKSATWWACSPQRSLSQELPQPATPL